VDGRHDRCRWPSVRPGLRWAMFKTNAACGESLLPAIRLLCTTLVCLAQQRPLRSVSRPAGALGDSAEVAAISHITMLTVDLDTAGGVSYHLGKFQ
jgi:hypothetical protein